MKKMIKAACCLFLGTVFALNISAQETSKVPPIDFSVQLKTKHLWRGLEVSEEVMTAGDINISTYNKNFTFGLWGGAGFNGNFKEFDYYASFQKNGFKLAVWDIYNFSKGASYNNTHAFEYSARETGHFIDVSVAYTFQGKCPLTLSWATVVFGRDRGSNNEKNLYSSYVAAEYPVIRGKIVDLDLGIAGAFALNPEKGTTANFYARSAGIVNISATASKKIKLGSYTLPVSVMAMFNPANNDVNMQIALDLF